MAACSAAACCASRLTRCGQFLPVYRGDLLPACEHHVVCTASRLKPDTVVHPSGFNGRGFCCLHDPPPLQMARAAEARQREKEAALVRLEKVIGVHGKQVRREQWLPFAHALG